MAASLSAATLAAIAEAVAAALASTAPVSAPVSPTEASAHWKARDVACTAKKPCARTFRTTKGRDWHVANVDHAAK